MIVDVEELQRFLEVAVSSVEINAMITFKSMFGGKMAYADGRPMASLSNVGLAFKLAPKDQEDLLTGGGERLRYEPDAPPSKQYIVVPDAMLSNGGTLGSWAAKSAAFVLSLPEKKKK